MSCFPIYHSLIVQFAPGDTRRRLHTVAQFSPWPFNVTAPLQLSIPRYLCSDTPQQDFSNHIVLISRGNCSEGVCDGNCTFADKAYYAQLFGAVGVIIGNTPDHKNELFRIPAPPNYPHQITIPTIFIASHTHAEIRKNLTCNGCNRTGIFQPIATMNYEVEVIDPTDTNSDTLRLAGFLLLVLPIGWCLIAALCFIRKYCQERRKRDQRSNVARDMPMVAYRRMSDSNPQQQDMGEQGSNPNPRPASPTQIRIHNESCAICLEDFTPELQIKLLPCGHGFHDNCIDPWLNERSELCPICKSSILDHQSSNRGLLSCVDCR